MKSPKTDYIVITCRCGKEFNTFPYRADAKYCSMDCQRKYRTYSKPGKLTENCAQCGSEFTTWECKQKNGNGKFCSKECFNSSIPEGRPIEFAVSEKGCFIVTSHIPYTTGYVVVGKRSSKRIAQHRIVYEECFGEIPDGLVVRHKCDVRNCINPEHLEIGTQHDNVMDTVKRGRTLRGERHPGHKLNEETVREIKALIASGKRNCEISKALNINKSTICNIKRGSSWSYITT